MGVAELFLLAVGLSMDAFAVSICKGLAMPKVTVRNALIVGFWFGGFQALMPLVGYLLGVRFRAYITAVDHWIAFALLAFIGGKMIYDAVVPQTEEGQADPSLTVRTMLVLAVATSIDALAVGISFAFLGVQIAPAVTFIGVVTFFLSMAGVKIGNVFGARYQTKAELAGGIILVLLGFKILLEHLDVLQF